MRGLKKNCMGRGQTDRKTHRQTDIATTRKNRPKGRFFEKGGGEDLSLVIELVNPWFAAGHSKSSLTRPDTVFLPSSDLSEGAGSFEVFCVWFYQK